MKALGIAIYLLLSGLGVAAAQVEPPPVTGNDDPQLSDGQLSEEAPAVESDTNDSGAALESFHDELASYGGRWINRPEVGEVWAPPVPTGWRPYTNGHWANTDQGWGWMADEPWGWATFHYGRWGYYEDLGWAWVPGNVWAPAWVAWQEGPGYVGWAPLPPSVEFNPEVGLGVGVAITAGFFTFVAERDFLAPRVTKVLVPTARNGTLLHNCRDITRYQVVGHRVYNSGIDLRRIEQATHHAVPRLQVAKLPSGGLGERGPFYRPPAVARAERTSHGEFGHFLPARVVEERRRSRPQGLRERSPRSENDTSRETRPRQFNTPDQASHPRPGTMRPRFDSPTPRTERTSRPSYNRNHPVPVQPAPHYHPGPSRAQPRPQPSQPRPRPQPKVQPKPQPRTSPEKSRHKP